MSGVKASAAVAGAPEEGGVKKAIGGPGVAVLNAPEKEPRRKCYEKRVGEEATFLETAKDMFAQFKEKPARTHWICLRDRVRAAGEYVSQKRSSVFSKQKVEPVVKEPTPDVLDKDGSTPEVADMPAAEQVSLKRGF